MLISTEKLKSSRGRALVSNYRCHAGGQTTIHMLSKTSVQHSRRKRDGKKGRALGQQGSLYGTAKWACVQTHSNWLYLRRPVDHHLLQQQAGIQKDVTTQACTCQLCTYTHTHAYYIHTHTYTLTHPCTLHICMHIYTHTLHTH